MPLVYVTGLSGSGKSAVLNALSNMGFEAHGVDEEGFADWIDRQTGDISPFPHGDPALNIHGWYVKHRWVLSAERITELKYRADTNNQLVFLAGVAEGEERLWHLFDSVVVLSVDEKTIRSRIEQRTDNQFGKEPEEMDEILFWLSKFDAKHRELGAIVVDARKSLDEVVSDVVQAAQHC